MSSEKETMFKKRAHTSAMSGQLYKTKLVSLVLFKMLHDERFEHFCLTSNLDEIGSFDDLCFKVKLKGIDRSVLVFIQAKHKDDDNSFVDFDDATSFHDSYLKVMQKINSCNEDKIFDGKFDEDDCIFILYTNAKHSHDSDVKYDSTYASVLNDLLATGKGGTHLHCTDKIIEIAAKTTLNEEVASLAEHFARFLTVNSNQSMQILLDNYILRYHVLLATSVVNISNIQCDEQNTDFKWRNLTFREDFFETNDASLMLLKKAIYKQILQHQIDEQKETKHVEDPKAKAKLSIFFENPCASTLGTLIGTHIEYKDDALAFIFERTKVEIHKLEQINLSQAIIEEAEAIAARNILLSLEIKVPVTFGGIDLMISENRIPTLINSIVNLCENFKLVNGHKIVTLDETIEDGLLNVSGGLAGAVGNLLVYDEDTKLLQFTNSCTSLQNNARIALDKLNSNITDLRKYRFYVKPTVSFPKLSFDCNEMAKVILQKLVVYAQQSNQNKLQDLLIKQIKDFEESQNLQVRPETIFLNYHAAIQAWWLLKIEAPYLTKDTQIYQDALNSIILEPLINSLKTAYIMTKMKNIEYTTHTLETLQRLIRQIDETNKLILAEKTVIVTDVTILTTMKVTQYLNYKGMNNYALLDLSYTINLSSDEFCVLKDELKKTTKYVIIICEKIQSGMTLYEKYLKEIAQAVEEKQKVVITNSMFLDIVLDAFSLSVKETTQNQVRDSIIYENHSLTDFTQDSQKNITKNGKVIFQGQEIDLNLILDDTSSAFIEGPVLNNIIFNEAIELGNPFSDPNYDEISHLYQDRTVEYKNPLIISGKICVTAVDNILGDVPPCKQEDQPIDSILAINLLEDPNNYNNPLECSDNNDGPFYIDFHFTCRMNQRNMVEEDFVKIIFKPEVQDDPTYLFSIKKKDVINKVWIVKVTLLDCKEIFKIWQLDKKTDKDTLNTLRNLCEGVVFDNIVRNENYKMSRTTGVLNLEMVNNLFKESNSLWHTDPCSFTVTDELQKDIHAIAGPSRDKEEKLSLSSNDKSFDSPTTQKKNVCKFNFNSNSTSNDRQEQVEDNATINYEGESSDIITSSYEDAKTSSHKDVTDKQSDFVRKLSRNCTEDFYNVVPNVRITPCNDDFDNVLVDDDKANIDKTIRRPIIDLPWHQNSSDLEDLYVYNFGINYYYKHQMNIKTFDDIKNDVILLTAKAGVGKSTLLAHLSREKKKHKNNVWIIKINLVNYSGIFRKWRKDKSIVIDTIETLKFICRVIIKSKNISFELKESCDKIYLKNCSGDAWDRFNLNMFLHYYNERKLMMLFDGFDEICPDYKDEVIKLLEVVKNFPQTNKMWITSRPYNSILPDLEQHFGDSFMIAYFNKTERSQYLSNFWINLFSIKNINENNVHVLLTFISQLLPFLDIKLKIICYDFYNFILTKFSLTSPAVKLSCERIEAAYKSRDTTIFNSTMPEINEFLGTPLLLYLSATYFVNEILNFKNTTRTQKDWRRCVSISTMYENFIETKLRKILFEEKCGLNVDIPFINETCELELIECMAIHKKLGAHTVFGSPLFIRFGLYTDEFKEMTPFKLDTEAGKKEFHSLIDRIWIGKERTGLISHVTDDHVPVFIHKTFAEFFAFEYVYDLIKSKALDEETKKLLLLIVLAITTNNSEKDESGDPVFSPNSMSLWMAAKGLVDGELEKLLVEVYNEWPMMTQFLEDVDMARLPNLPHVKNEHSTDLK